MSYQPSDVLLDTYRIEELIAEGSFGDVYRVTHLGLKVERAIKVLKRSASGIGSTEISDCQQRFEMEAQLGAELNTPSAHPNLLQVHNFQHIDDLLILEMEYAPGGSLAGRIAHARKTKQPIPIDEVVQIGIDVASGLAELHELDIVHRDLKPNNILFDGQGRAKVADLGLAQIPGGPSMRTRLSNPPPHPGTPGYMSPEQKNSRDYLPSASDSYALGLVLFETLTGKVYKGKPAGTRVRSLRPDVPGWLDDLITKILSDDPQNRPWDGNEVAALLKRSDQDKKCLSRFPRWVCLLAGIIIILGLIFGSMLIRRGTEIPTPTDTMITIAETTKTVSPTAKATPSPTATLTSIPTKSPVPTSTYTQKPTNTVQPSPTLSPSATIDSDPTVYDNFNNPAFDGRFHSGLWDSSDPPEGHIVQQNGILMMKKESQLANSVTGLAALRYLDSSLFDLTSNKPTFFEAKLMLDSSAHAGNIYLNLGADLGEGSWLGQCYINASSNEQEAWGSCFATNWERRDEAGYDYQAEGNSVFYDTWHVVRIELYPSNMEIKFYLDNNLIGSHIPLDSDKL